MFGLQQYNCFLFSVESTRAATVLIVYLKWAIYELQKPLHTQRNTNLPFTENSRNTYVKLLNNKQLCKELSQNQKLNQVSSKQELSSKKN